MAAPSVMASTELPQKTLPPLEQGDHLDQEAFHVRYKAMPQGSRAELIGGVVYMPSPLKVAHAKSHPLVNFWLTLYGAATPGAEVLDSATTILGEDSEPQPDDSLILLPDFGGQTHEDEEGFLHGAPELVVEVASSSESYDLHSKKLDYERAGVLEYVVLALRQERVIWFVRGNNKFVPLESDADGIYRSRIFPGLWLDPQALIRRDAIRIQEVLNQGLSSAEHARFVEDLKQKKARA